MRRISANYVYPITSPPIRNGIVETDDDGTIRKVYDFGGEMVELAHTEFLNGVLVPGFINMHTHLEFSNFNRIEPPLQDLTYFIENVIKNRTDKDALEEALKADKFMHRKGIVAACDIANTNITIPVKKKSKIRYHTFAEITGLRSDKAFEKLMQIKNLIDEYRQNDLNISLAPHAPYSISSELWELLSHELVGSDLSSMHNQESHSENQMFQSGEGKLLDLFKTLELICDWTPQKESSLKSVLNYLNAARILLVHNSFTSREDINALTSKHSSFGFVLCPTSNMQISGQLPDIEMLEGSGMPLMLGTDSLASGQSLDLLDEMKCFQSELNLPFEKMLNWATINAATFMNWNDLGSFSIGKKPGVNLISGFDFKSMKLKSSSTIRRIL